MRRGFCSKRNLYENRKGVVLFGALISKSTGSRRYESRDGEDGIRCPGRQQVFVGRDPFYPRLTSHLLPESNHRESSQRIET